jgi:phage protein D
LTGADIAYFGSPQLMDRPQAVLSVNMGLETNVSGFTVRYEMLRPTTAIAAGLEPGATTSQSVKAATALQHALGREGTLARILPPPVVRLADTGMSRAPELQTVAQAVADRSTWAVVAEGRAAPDVGVLRPGRLVNVRGAGRVFNGSYYVTRVTHTIGREGYAQRFEARRNAVEMTGTEVYRAP